MHKHLVVSFFVLHAAWLTDAGIRTALSEAFAAKKKKQASAVLATGSGTDAAAVPTAAAEAAYGKASHADTTDNLLPDAMVIPSGDL